MTAARLELLADGRAKVSGRLSFRTVPDLWRESEPLFDAAGETLEFDLNDVERTDSAGLALLVSWIGRARGESKSIRYTGAGEQLCTLAEANDICALLGLRC